MDSSDELKEIDVNILCVIISRVMAKNLLTYLSGKKKQKDRNFS